MKTQIFVKIIKFGKNGNIEREIGWGGGITNGNSYSQKSSAYSSLVSIENLFQAWEEFKKGKRKKLDVLVFERRLEDNLFELHQRLATKTYQHGLYSDFYVQDPKRRHIHKAEVSDRIVHHVLYKYLYQIFDPSFIFDSYSCRLGKGTHKAVERLEKLTRKVSQNFTRDFWVLKCDIKKFFASVDHGILNGFLKRKVQDKDTMWFVEVVIDSFRSELGKSKGIPLGNLTSQIFANIYLNELDQFVKQKLKVRYYFRYADDFIILESNRSLIHRYIDRLNQFLQIHLKLKLHPNKLVIRKLSWGIDFCGYVVLPHCILLRKKTRRRIFKKVFRFGISDRSLQSYLGYFSHAKAYKVSQALKNLTWLRS